MFPPLGENHFNAAVTFGWIFILTREASQNLTLLAAVNHWAECFWAGIELVCLSVNTDWQWVVFAFDLEVALDIEFNFSTDSLEPFSHEQQKLFAGHKALCE